MRYVGLIPHLDKEAAIEAARILLGLLAKYDLEIFLPQEAANLVPGPVHYCAYDRLTRDMDLLFVLGGDGTLLQTARRIAGSGIPILGINVGHLGFLTELEPSELAQGVELLFNGAYHVEERMMLKAEVYREEKLLGSYLALNDAVVTRGPVARIINLETRVNEQLIGNFAADGIIVSTPTGSTAYNLSAGGPVVHPLAKNLIITPICPHTLSVTRSVLTLPEEEIRIRVQAVHTDTVLTVDGRLETFLKSDDVIHISQAEEKTRLVRVLGRGFYEVLRNRLAHPEV
ncbi:MAG: NAD(+)/NADH kinase [Limnochordia bacterium]|jgi:NAD+ kinase